MQQSVAQPCYLSMALQFPLDVLKIFEKAKAVVHIHPTD